MHWEMTEPLFSPPPGMHSGGRGSWCAAGKAGLVEVAVREGSGVGGKLGSGVAVDVAVGLGGSGVTVGLGGSGVTVGLGGSGVTVGLGLRCDSGARRLRGEQWG